MVTRRKPTAAGHGPFRTGLALPWFCISLGVATLLLSLGCGDRLALEDAGSCPAPAVLPAVTQHEVDERMVQKVIAAAREQIRAAGLLETVRPEPSQVIDREDHWEVLFEKKGSIVEVDGKQIVQKQKPSSLRVVVRKSDMTATLVPGR